MSIEHDAGAHAESLNRKCENACAKLASREHLFPKKAPCSRPFLPCSPRGSCASSLISLKAKRGVDGRFGREGCQYVRDGHDTPDIMCADLRRTQVGFPFHPAVTCFLIECFTSMTVIQYAKHHRPQSCAGGHLSLWSIHDKPGYRSGVCTRFLSVFCIIDTQPLR